jgi:hypothetical protein
MILIVLMGLLVAAGSNDKKQTAQDVEPARALMAQQLTANLKTFYSTKALEDGVYVGAEFCIACHTDYSVWRDTKHAQALRRPMAEYSLQAGKGVVADYDSNGVDDFMQGLDFNQIDSAFDAFKPNAPILSYNEGTYYITIGEQTMPVVITQGGTGDWKQRYLLRVPVTDTADGLSMENYVSPVQYNEKTHGYVIYHSEAWYNDDNSVRFGPDTSIVQVAAENGRSYSKKCIGCHSTGLRELGKTETDEWLYRPYPAALHRADDPSYPDYDHDGISDIVNVSCEACHGPGSQHILASGNPEMIVNPSDLEPAEANMVCGQCHSRIKSVPNATHDWAINDETYVYWQPGSETPLSDFFTDAAGRWPDGVSSKQHHQQYFDFLASGKPDFPFHPVMCIECHDSHGNTANKHLIRDVIPEEVDGEELLIPVENDNDSLCLACHASHGAFSDLTKPMVADFDTNRDAIAKVVSEHTHHPFAPERSMGLSRCSKCHNPKIAKSAIHYDVHSHTFEAIPPEKNLAFQDAGGMPDSCSVSCHGTKVDSFGLGLDFDLNDWDDDHSRTLSEKLMYFYGPSGVWWQHSIDEGEGGE